MHFVMATADEEKAKNKASPITCLYSKLTKTSFSSLGAV